MWMIISGSALAVAAVFMALAKASSKADQMSERHREELLARAKGKEKAEEEINETEE